MRRKFIALLAIAATAVAAPLVAAAPASAATPHTCFGYTGNFKEGSRIEYADWNTDGTYDECFGVTPARHIYHAWRNSGGWKEMPNGGRADNLIGSFRIPVEGIRRVIVRVTGGDDYYSQRVETSSQGWLGWYNCRSSCD